jgi:hypothetical protein
MITESYQDYKGYTIRLRAATGGGFGYDIIKQINNDKSPNGVKKVYLRKQIFDFIEPNKLLFKAKNYIDNFENKLIEKFNKINRGNQ